MLSSRSTSPFLKRLGVALDKKELTSPVRAVRRPLSTPEAKTVPGQCHDMPRVGHGLVSPYD